MFHTLIRRAVKKNTERRWRAIDLYSGIGGWSLGLQLAGIDVVASYDRWGEANETNFKNNHHHAQPVDIRGLNPSDLPKAVDVVVGSPPCTEFSYSNRGGGGDIADGLQDIINFLNVVDFLKPKAWAMENVPRVAVILRRELKARGKLARFRHLAINIAVVDMSEYGLPQKRRRCIAGSFSPELLQSYSVGACSLTLGAVVRALKRSPVRDPVYGISLEREYLTDHVAEMPLDAEEIRINKAVKTLHPVYNAMPFPDDLDRPSRTITATCTRVSRESIIIEPPRSTGRLRRLTIRERACLQGFPITYQFYASSHSHKARMVGNAVPPLFAYFVAHALKGTPADLVPSLRSAGKTLTTPSPLAASAEPPRPSKKFPIGRTFRFSIGSLHLKSGVRFELTNVPDWAVRFYFGSSNSIHEIDLRPGTSRTVLAQLPRTAHPGIQKELDKLAQFMADSDIRNMQRVWEHKGPGGTSPLVILDKLGTFATRLKRLLKGHDRQAQAAVGEVLLEQFGHLAYGFAGLHKLSRNALTIACGLLIGATANTAIAAHSSKKRGYPD